jgi:hypothetical protein
MSVLLEPVSNVHDLQKGINYCMTFSLTLFKGMGGLASALALAKNGFRNIHVYETASNLGFVGAGIQLAPNMARILDDLDCWADIEKEATDVRETSIRRM